MQGLDDPGARGPKQAAENIFFTATPCSVSDVLWLYCII